MAGKWLFLVFVVTSALTGAGRAQADDRALVVEANFARLAEQMRARNLPLMLLISHADCPYCNRLKTELLNPMLLSGEYGYRVMMREIVTDVDRMVFDFQGKRLSVVEFAGRFHAWVAPTLLFLDAAGSELSPRIVGYQTPGLFPFAVEQAITSSQAAIARAPE